MIEHLFGLVKIRMHRNSENSPHERPQVPPRHDPKFDIGPTKQNRLVRRLHGHMKRDTLSLVAVTLRTGLLVGLAVLLILVLFPAIAAQAAGPR